jgi:hypothetical protein
MTRTALLLRLTGAAFAILVAVGRLVWIGTRDERMDPVVRAWYITAPDAPFPHHVFTFHQDGTMSQANADAGDQQSGDSDGAGTWTRRGRSMVGVLAETTAAPVRRSAPAASSHPQRDRRHAHQYGRGALLRHGRPPRTRTATHISAR